MHCTALASELRSTTKRISNGRGCTIFNRVMIVLCYRKETPYSTFVKSSTRACNLLCTQNISVAFVFTGTTTI